MIKTTLKFTNLKSFAITPQYLILHHAAGTGSVETIHNYHLSKGWSGIAYHLYVRKDGSVYQGRPIDKQGGHCSGYNNKSIGICFEGNFETEPITQKQLAGGVEAIQYALSHYPNLKIVGHKELCNTSCPGKNFPLDYFKRAEADEVTQEQFNQMMETWLETQNNKPQSNWSAKEGYFDSATAKGIVDGNKPQGFVTREQLTAVIGRIGLIK